MNWVSINTIPNTEEFVLLCYKKSELNNIRYCKVSRVGYFDVNDANITHWMPLPEPPQGFDEWNSIYETLPVKRVLLCYKKDLKSTVNYCVVGKLEDFDGVNKFITHWMPLPEPPQEQRWGGYYDKNWENKLSK